MSQVPEPSLSELMRPERIALHQSLASKQAMLDRIGQLAVPSLEGSGLAPDQVAAALREREEVGSTGFGGGIAIPHCRLEGLDRFVVGLVTTDEKGVEFAALDDEPVRLALFILAPQGRNDRHVRLLSAISQALQIPGAVDAVLAAVSPAEARAVFLEHVRTDLASDSQSVKQLFHVFVQEEEQLRRILEVFTALDAHSVAVLEARQAHSYLVKAPLFAGLWSEQVGEHCHLIVAALNQRLSNEAVRRIEQVTGPLRESREVLLTIQDVAFVAGSLSI